MSTKRIVYHAVLIALIVLLSQVHFLGSLSLESVPVFLGAALFGVPSGFVLGVVGHLLVASITGFPFTIPVHIAVAMIMGIAAGGFGWAIRFFKKHSWWGAIVGIIIAYIWNVVIGLLVTALMLPGMEIGVLIIPLSAITLINLIIALVVYRGIRKVYDKDDI